jgi:signal transduction histidine kinase/predicted negative regulator of RcsB-dependent stress response
MALKLSHAFFLCLIPFSIVFSQSGRHIDSLQRELSGKIPDTVRVSLLISLASSYTYVDFRKSQDYAREAVSLADKIDHNRLKLKAKRILAVSSSLGGDYTTALDYETVALQIALAIKDSTEIGLSHSNIGNYYHEMGDYDEAYYYLTRAHTILRQGKVTHDDSILINITVHNVGRVLKELGQYETAIQHLKLSKQRSIALGDLEGNPYALDELGDVMLRMGKYDSALIYLHQALAETRALIRDNPESIVSELHAKTLIKIASIYLQTGAHDRALAYYDSTFHLHKITNNKFGIAEVELGRGSLFLNERDFDRAEEYIYKALTISKANNARILEIKCYNKLSILWELRGEYKKSLEYFKLYKTTNDSLYGTEMQQKIFRDQIRFATESKDIQIDALTKMEEFRKSELRKQELIRNVLVVVVALTVILLFTVYRSGQRRKRINTLLLQHQEEIKKRSVELEQLNQVKDKFFSIISHDLRSPINALAGILDLLEKGAIDSNELPSAIKELRTRFNHTRTLLNNLLDWTLVQMDKMKLKPTRINLKQLVEENIALMGSMQTKKLNFINDVSTQAFAFADNNTVNLVIRNLISNALKFTHEGGAITIATEEKENEWVISVADNGIGMNPEIKEMLFDKINPYSTRGTANEKGTGLGLILCKEFIEKNNGRIWVESQERQGSTFWFTLPKSTG